MYGFERTASHAVLTLDCIEKRKGDMRRTCHVADATSIKGQAKNGIRPLVRVLGGGLICAIVAPLAVATSTGLNNIPTADTPPDRTVVFQMFTNMGDEQTTDWFAGFKMGHEFGEHHFEWGLDGRFGEGEEGPAVFQAKYAIQPWENLPTLGAGAANIAVTDHDRDEVGQAFKFLVLTQDFGWLRGHVGYGLQKDNNAAFVGLDKTFRVFERDLMLRSDFIEIDDQDQWLGSAGFIYFLHKHIAVESWVSQPFKDGEPTFTLKLNLIFEF